MRDEAIAAHDKKSEELLARITGASRTGSRPDCAVLAELRAALQLLVETQKAKWSHMFAKLETELAK